MINSGRTINYFPLTEIISFSLAILACTFILYKTSLSIWLIIPSALFLYFLIMRDAFIIKIHEGKLKIIPFNVFIVSAALSIKSIIKIISVQEREDDSYGVFGAPYFSLKRRYELEYTDSDGQKRKTYFSISNVHKEKLIVEALKSQSEQLSN